MSSTTSSRCPVFAPDVVRRYLESDTRGHGLRWSSTVFPCPCEIFLVLSSAVHHHKLRTGRYTEIHDPLHSENYRQTLRQLATSPEMSWEESGLAECYHSGATLFINGLFKHPDRAVEALALVRTVLRHAKALLLNNPRQRFLAWPLYQAGLDCRKDSEDARWIEGYFSQLSSSSGCQHGANGLIALRSFWSTATVGDRTSPTSTELEGQLTLV